jgi:GntR family transcriptional regulator, rspAB operon transcriptional repressor
MEDAAYQGDAFALIELDMAFHLAIFKLSGLEALEQILTRCTIHTHRSKLWAPSHKRPLLETARRHNVLLEHLEAGDAEGLAHAIGVHIDTIVTKGDS